MSAANPPVVEGAILADARRVLGTSTERETVARALDLVLHIAETLQGTTVPCVRADACESAGAVDSLGQSPGYRERLLASIPRVTHAGVPIRTALAAGGADALLAEIVILHLQLQERDVELTSRAHEIERYEDERLQWMQRLRVLQERVDDLERARAGLRAELRRGRLGSRQPARADRDERVEDENSSTRSIATTRGGRGAGAHDEGGDRAEFREVPSSRCSAVE